MKMEPRPNRRSRRRNRVWPRHGCRCTRAIVRRPPFATSQLIPHEGLDAAQTRANALVTRVRLGRSRRWKPQPRGVRFDVRRTLRASLHTGGDAMVLHRLGHPLRNPRFVVLLDGSRSMECYAGAMLLFALALCRRTRRADAFLFSTALRDVTRDLRDAARSGSYRLAGLGEAWGGGTRIGASLNAFVRRFGARLTSQTFVIIFSDGLDVGDIPELDHAMREIARRSAAIAWVNPHAGEPGYVPSARGMQAALPYVDRLRRDGRSRRACGDGATRRMGGEVRDVFAFAAAWLEQRGRFARATLVALREAATAPIGTTIAVDERGHIVGNIGAGCYESEIVEACLLAAADGRTRTLDINLTSDDELLGGTACGAVMEVVVWRPADAFANTARDIAAGERDVRLEIPYERDDRGPDDVRARYPLARVAAARRGDDAHRRNCDDGAPARFSGHRRRPAPRVRNARTRPRCRRDRGQVAG